MALGHDPDLNATINIAPEQTLEATAAELGELFGVSFTENSLWQFDGYPSYSAEAGGFVFNLLGIPEPEHLDPDAEVEWYSLHLYATAHKADDPWSDGDAMIAALVRERTGLKVRIDFEPFE